MAKLVEVGYRDNDVYLHCAPLFHIGGLSSALALLMVGGLQVPYCFAVLCLHYFWEVMDTSQSSCCHASLCPRLACS